MSDPVFWVAESEIRESVDGYPLLRCWAVGVGDQEIAWFRARGPAISFKNLCNGEQEEAGDT